MMSNRGRIVVVDNGTRHLQPLLALCRSFGNVAVVAPDDLSVVTDSDLVVLSGSHAHYVAGPRYFYAQERHLVESHRGTLIGVCAGMELIASVYGGTLGKMRFGASGVRSIRLQDPALRFALGGLPTAKVSEHHSWAVTSVHRPLIVLAASDGGIEVLRHESRPVLGLQFHPELAPADGRRIFEWALTQANAALPLLA